VPAPSVRQDPSRKAVEALSYLESRVERVLVHLDVDVLDTGAFPLANFPHFAGLTLAEVAACLEVFCASPKFAGLIVTEVNPDHDPDAVLLSQLLDVLVQALLGVPGQSVGGSRKS
jgi:arginase